MARGGARPGAGRPARKSAHTSPPSRVRAPAREMAAKIKGRGRRTRSSRLRARSREDVDRCAALLKKWTRPSCVVRWKDRGLPDTIMSYLKTLTGYGWR